MRHTLASTTLFTVLGVLAIMLSAAAPAPSPRPAAASTPPEPGDGTIDTDLGGLNRLINFPGLEDPKATLSEVLATLAKKHDLVFEVNELAFKYEQVPDVLKTEVANPNPLPAMNVSLETVLRKILSRIPVPSGVTFLLRHNRIEITTGIFLKAEVWGQFNLDGPFLPLVHANVRRCPLDRALRGLAEETDFNIVLDASTGTRRQTPVTALLLNTPLDTAVRLLADQANLSAVRLGNVLYVTSRPKAVALEAEEKKRQAKRPPNPLDEVRFLAGPHGTILRLVE